MAPIRYKPTITQITAAAWNWWVWDRDVSRVVAEGIEDDAHLALGAAFLFIEKQSGPPGPRLLTE